MSERDDAMDKIAAYAFSYGWRNVMWMYWYDEETQWFVGSGFRFIQDRGKQWIGD